MKTVVSLFLYFSLLSSHAAQILSDHWYTMQAGSTPWGYYHEIIEQNESHYRYRYTMTKKDGDELFQESVGALSKLDLTPISLNIFKEGKGSTLKVDATLQSEKAVSSMKVVFSGSLSKVKNSVLNKDTILDVFFPVWVKKNMSKLKQGSKGSLSMFMEEPSKSDFLTRTVQYEVGDQNSKAGCRNIIVTYPNDGTTIRWCTTMDGILVEMDGPKDQKGAPSFQVRKAADESVAKAFIGGIRKKK